MSKIIKSINIKNFRGIKEHTIDFDNFNMFIGDNGTNKTSILEAINYSFSPSFLSGRIKPTDFHKGINNSIEITIYFENEFKISILDGYNPREIECNKISLTINRRGKKSPGKILSDLVTIDHIVIPKESPRKDNDNKEYWSIKRKNGSEFKFDRRLLSFNVFQSDDMPRSFYFSKERDKQIYKGFNTSFSSIIDDFNWRYLKEIFKQNSNNLFNEIDGIEKKISELTQVEQHDVIKCFNERIKKFNLEPIDFSFIDRLYPFEQVFLSKKEALLNIPIKNLGSGIEMLYSVLFLDTLASFSKEKLIILIDEPELHLHPKLQVKFANYLFELSKNDKYQIFITTHSPIFFKNLCENNNVKSIITKGVNESFELKNYEPKDSIFPWGPTWGEINYFAYDYPTVEFHNELYGYLQEVTEKRSYTELDNYLNSRYGIQKDKDWTPEKNRQPQESEKVTLMTFIRHKIHHPENATMQSTKHTEEELQQSIKKMIEILKKLINDNKSKSNKQKKNNYENQQLLLTKTGDKKTLFTS